MIIPSIKVLPTPDAVSREAAQLIATLAREAKVTQRTISILLSGGSTPRALYELLATEELSSQIDWAKVQIYFGDERCVPPSDSQSNYHMAHEALLAKVPIPGDNIYRIRGELDPEEAAIEYGQLLKERFGDGGPDLVLLGMGEDGHTASLFPGTSALKEIKHRCVAVYVEKLKSWRITTTPPFLNRAGEVLVMVTGASKAARVQEVLEGLAPEPYPIQLIQPKSGRITWLLDAAAAGMGE